MRKLLSAMLVIAMLCGLLPATATETPLSMFSVDAASLTTFTYVAPYAGIYRVTSDKAVTVTNETGSTATLTAGDAGKYIYLIKGVNCLITSDSSAVLTFTELDDNGMEHLSEIETAHIAYATDHTFFGERTDVGIHNFVLSGEGTYKMETGAAGQYIALSPNASITLAAEVSASGAGIVYPYLNIIDNNTHTFTVISDTGFYAELNKYLTNSWQTTCWKDNKNSDMEFLYVREGLNYITIKNTSNTVANVAGLRASMTDGSDSIANHEVWGPQINLENLKVVDGANSIPAPTPTPNPVNPDASDVAMVTTYEAENFTGGSLSKTVYSGAVVAKATSESTASYTVTVENDAVFNLYMKGAAWKDVSFDIAIDGTHYSYETLHFQSDRSSTYSYNEECVAVLPLAAGEHTLSFTFYCDTFYFDNFTLENTYSKQYKLLYGLKEQSTSQGIYEVFLSSGDLIGIDVEEDTADLVCPEMAFWAMVGKDYESFVELVGLYNTVVADQLKNPTVVVKDASGNTVNALGAGNYTVTLNRGSIPSNVSFVSAVYQGNKLAGNIQVLSGTGSTITFTLQDVISGSRLKLMPFQNMENIKPYTFDNAYCDIYVAPNGKSYNAGTSPDAPFSTLAQALKKVKEINSNMTGDIIIHMAPGVYRSNQAISIDQTMSGKNGYKVIIRAEDPDNRPVLSGGEPLTGKWSKVDGQNYWVAPTSTTETRALYVNGYQATMARSHEWYWGDPITPSSPKNSSHKADGIKVSLSERPNISRELAGESRMQIVFNLAWANQRFPVDSVTYDSKYAYVNTTYPYFNSFLLSIHTATIMPIDPNGHIRAFYLENAMALMDEPGEFYFDKKNQKMYYYPYANEDMSTAETYCAVSDGLLKIAGTSANKVKNLEFQNISFQHGAWDDATTYGAAFNQADELRRGTATHYTQHLMNAQIDVTYADSIVFDGCEFACLGSNAIFMPEGVTNSKVINSDFHDISGGGVSVGHYQHNSTYKGSGRCKNIEIGNNIFRRCVQEFYGLTAVAVYYADGVNIHHNDIKNVGYTGISVGWGWGFNDPKDCGNHTVTYNKVTDCLQVLDDGAQIYTLSDQKNTHVMDNYFINPGSFRRCGLYLDEGSGYIQICDNVFQDADDYGADGLSDYDYWLFARRNVNLNDNYCAYNHTDGGDVRYFSLPMDTAGVSYSNNNTYLKSWSNTAQRVMEEAGVEDKSRVAKVDYYPAWRTMRGVDVPPPSN